MNCIVDLHMPTSIINDVNSKKLFNPCSAGIDFIRWILTFKVDPRAARVKISIIAVDP